MDRRFQINERFGEYRVVGFIGQGGMGEVYQFYHEKLNRSVAVKVLGGTVSLDENYKTRFLNEARLQASLQHPNIATLYDFQEIGNELLIFMELVDGESLDSLIDRQFFSVEESLKVFESIVNAIIYVHANGIIHRDIKAENVKLNQQGIPKLLDFGIAKDYQSQNLTQVGGVVGTPNYLSPEQLAGEKADAQTDIWSLGVLLYRMLTGRLPFEADTFENLIYQIVQAKFEAPETYNPAVPKAVSQIVRKCLAKDLNQRYQTAEELLQEVRRVLNERYSGLNLFGSNKTKIRFSAAKLSFFAIPVFAFLGLLGLGIWVLSGTSDTGEINNNPVKENTVRENRNDLATKNTPTPKKTELPVIQSDSGGNKIKVRIDVIGGSAEVWRNGQKIGNTPFDLEVKESEAVSLKLRKEGFEDNDVQFEASSRKKVYTFALTRK